MGSSRVVVDVWTRVSVLGIEVNGESTFYVVELTGLRVRRGETRMDMRVSGIAKRKGIVCVLTYSAHAPASTGLTTTGIPTPYF